MVLLRPTCLTSFTKANKQLGHSKQALFGLLVTFGSFTNSLFVLLQRSHLFMTQGWTRDMNRITVEAVFYAPEFYAPYLMWPHFLGPIVFTNVEPVEASHVWPESAKDGIKNRPRPYHWDQIFSLSQNGQMKWLLSHSNSFKTKLNYWYTIMT